MSKKYSEMSLEELWELFPIIPEEHKSEWKSFYSEEEDILKDGLKECRILRISHIGSTAIKGIAAKPIVDILVEIAADEDIRKASAMIENCGYTCMSQSENRIIQNLVIKKSRQSADCLLLLVSASSMKKPLVQPGVNKKPWHIKTSVI